MYYAMIVAVQTYGFNHDVGSKVVTNSFCHRDFITFVKNHALTYPKPLRKSLIIGSRRLIWSADFIHFFIKRGDKCDIVVVPHFQYVVHSNDLQNREISLNQLDFTLMERRMLYYIRIVI